jgi:hypothetical protein
MKSFQEFVEELESEPSPLGEKGIGTEQPDRSIERPEMSDDNLNQIIKIAYKKHRHQTEKFIHRLAEVDPDIKAAMNGNKVPDGADQFSPNRDEVMPPDADGAPGLEDGDKN